jgi:hypothetical protein
MKEMLELQECWKIIEETARMVKEKDDALLAIARANPDWQKRNTLARLVLGNYISDRDIKALRDVYWCGERWNKLMAKYKPVNALRAASSMSNLTEWKMDPSISIFFRA